MHFLQTHISKQNVTIAVITARAITAHCGSPVASWIFSVSFLRFTVELDSYFSQVLKNRALFKSSSEYLTTVEPAFPTFRVILSTVPKLFVWLFGLFIFLWFNFIEKDNDLQKINESVELKHLYF